MNKALLLVIFATISSVKHIQARHYLVKTEQKADPEPQREKEAEARESTKTTNYSTPQKREPATFSRNTTSNSTEDDTCDRTLYGYYDGPYCTKWRQFADVATWRECATACYKMNHFTYFCSHWSMKIEDPDMHSYVCLVLDKPDGDEYDCSIHSDAHWMSGNRGCGKPTPDPVNSSPQLSWDNL